MGAEGLAELGLLSLLWGGVYVLTRIGLDELSPVVVVFARTALGAIALAPFVLLGRGRHRLRRDASWKWVAAVVLLQATVPLLLQTTGQQHVTSSQAGVLLATQPIFAAVLVIALDRREGYGPVGLVAVAIGFVGVMLLLGPGMSGDRAGLLSAALLLGASLCYAAGSVLLRLKLPGADPIAMATLALTASAVVLMVPSALSLPAQVPSARTLLSLVVLGVLSGGWALALFYRLVQRFGAARSSLAGYLAPAVAVGLGALVLEEPISATEVVGLALILVGSVLATNRRSVPASE
jgi:drug/metabolite transporter (DMT)-like permease